MASEAVKRQRAVRRRMFRRTMVASLALFMAIFTLMAGQMALGHDPAVGAKKQQAPQQVAQTSQPVGLKEAAGQAMGAVIGNVISGVAEGDDEGEHGGAPAQQQSAPAQSAPAPVQTGAS